MRGIIKYSSIILIVLLTTTCRKDQFIEPPDPFQEQRLEEGNVCFDFSDGKQSFKIRTNQENITTTEKGNLRIRGTIFADRDTLAPVKLSQGDFILLKTVGSNQKTVTLDDHGELPLSRGSFKMLNSDGSTCQEFKAFGGYAEFTLPRVGITQNLEIPIPDGAPIGFAKGSDLPDFPVHPDRTYFYFYYPEPVDFAMSQSAFSINRMALDPNDPYFYVHANALSIPGLSSLEEGGFATSVQGVIPFNVPSSLNFGNVESFNYGNILLEGSINLETTFGVPIVIADATCVIGFGNLADGTNFFNGAEVPMMMGLKGGFLLSISDLAQWHLGDAAVSLRIGGYDDFDFSFAGYYDTEISIFEPITQLTGLEPSNFAFDFIQPPQQAQQLYTWGTIGTDPDNWALGLKSDSYMNFPGITKIDLGGVSFYISSSEFDFDCRMPIGFFGTIGLSGNINRSGAFRFKAYARAGESFSKWGLSIDVGYKAHFILDVDALDDWYFEVYGKVYLDISIGEEWIAAHDVPELKSFNDPRLKASVEFEARLNSSGKFKGKIRFSFWKIGYEFGFTFSLTEPSPTSFDYLIEIPIDQVPLENRFEIEH